MSETTTINHLSHCGPQGQPYAVRARFAGGMVEAHYWTEGEAQDARDVAFDAGATAVHVRGLPTRGYAVVPQLPPLTLPTDPKTGERLMKTYVFEFSQTIELVCTVRVDSEGAMLDAAELKLRAERRLGELLAENLSRGRPKKMSHDATFIPDGITRSDSSRWQKIATIPDETFEKHLAESREAGELTTAGALRLAKKLLQPGKQESAPGNGCTVEDLQSLAESGKRFGCIYADPPWQYDNQSTRAATDNHYQTMTVEQIAALPIRDLAAESAHLHLWTTNAFLFDCPRIMEAWDFDYKGMFLWCKPQMGIGNYWRVSHEILLLGTRKNCPFAEHDEMSWGQFDRGRHSSKPEQIRHIIELVSPAPRLELFGRLAVDGWTVWGNEIERDLFAKN